MLKHLHSVFPSCTQSFIFVYSFPFITYLEHFHFLSPLLTLEEATRSSG